MKAIYKPSVLMLLAVITLASCGKKDTPKPATPTNNISALVGNWQNGDWGGVNGDVLIFTVNGSTDKGTVDAISGSGYGFATGDVIFSNIKANADGTYSCSASYSPTGSGLSTRSATMTLSDNNTELTVNYPAINADFPAITYGFQQTSVTVFAE